MSDAPDQTYPGGFEQVVALWQRRRRPLDYARGEALPGLGVDLAALAVAVVAEPAALPAKASGYATKRFELARIFVGKSELALLNALLISNLRKAKWPGHAPTLFRRLWAEQSGVLLAELDTRWLISSIITFSDHGMTEAERRTGQAFSLLFSLMKLYEYERLFSGLPPEKAFSAAKRRVAALPMRMEPFSIAHGGLDVNLLAPIWEEATRAPLIAPLARHLLQALDRDPGTLFRRIKKMKAERLATKALKRAEPEQKGADAGGA